jgi:hypothetical protein
MAFGRGLSDAERAQRVAPSPLVLPDAGFSGGLGAVDRALRDLRRMEDRLEQQTEAALNSLRYVRREWLNPPATYLGRALVCLCFVVRAWADHSGRTAAARPVWWDEPALATGAATATMPAHPSRGGDRSVWQRRRGRGRGRRPRCSTARSGSY